ncbi:LutB/LldF family L-lactate oxidation iron-sulfur protein [Fodinisporobacter ferrooxydans]|uniref:LutB/LldF family L-lactate oxidation iron-sulfur protein n=1 Tax=Fodinisporobacter ferrooxydans TaxID=2901836 RepID=A0ABY4CP59_9BACL|nr:LutB/LldF family L-lactate oxidation iron-sulfur protein [Alicyclobacillaceae bacterium MYW30-H2]
MTTAHTHSQTDIKERSHLALQDDFLRAAVRFTTGRLKNNKLKTTEELGRWEEWRERGKQIRSHTIAHLDYYVKQFADQIRTAGGSVYFAANAAEAVAIALDIAAKKEAKLVVKSKSMVSEEIHINAHLKEKNIAAVETDLGEYIIQLAGETPSHIIIPAIHKNRQQIKELFTAAGGENLTTDTKVLVAFARQTLREKFQKAEIGLTGCNFGIAESGTIVLFTNEGNGRMVSTLPKTHIVTMGMERLLPTFSDLEVVANLLPRSATGQKITAYMSMINGPRRAQEIDGPEELHVILLDNGRSKQLGDEEFQEVLNCIRCGACLNVCPVYRHIGGHAYGSVYPGPIGAVLSPLLNEGEQWSDLPYASSLCGACYEACPVKIPLHDMLVHLRRRNVEKRRTKLMERMAFKGFQTVFGKPGRYRLAMNSARSMQKPLERNGYIESTFGPLFGWTNQRHAPAMAQQPFRDRFASLKKDLTHAQTNPSEGGNKK